MKNCNGNIYFKQPPRIVSYASVVGKKEGEGPLREYFDRIIYDSYAGRDTFEQAESQIMSTAVQLAMKKGCCKVEDVDLSCCGDLLNQCVASSFAMRQFGVPYAGVYGACSTMALSMIMAAIAVESGAAERAVCAASSHYCTAERQYRFPLEYGSQRPPTAQWTVTGAGACIIDRADSQAAPPCDPSSDPRQIEDHDVRIEPAQHRSETRSKPFLNAARLGRIVDYDVCDQNNMGAAMAPAVVKLGTLLNLPKTA
ncbi:MAG: hypothetical protein IJG87_11170 [Ruminococcus sp.]|nr:hypothetical protein [Ruminococcus sp.]